MRLEGQIKMGYYPTPLRVVERVRSFLKLPEKKVTILDPCCGEGLAVKKLVEGINAETYGIELDKKRAEEAISNLDHVLACGYEEARITNNTFSILWLNPPYDFETMGDNVERMTERKEKTFLINTIKYLKVGGILIYIIPQLRLDKSIAKTLSSKFENIQGYRFMDGEYEGYKQIVVFGRKKRSTEPDETEYLNLAQVPGVTLDEIPVMAGDVYDVPTSDEIPLFRSSVIELEELEREVRSSPIWKRLNEMFLRKNAKLRRPPLPLHSGHLGLLLASGCLDGLVGEGDERHIVRGKVAKVVQTYQEVKDKVTEEHQVESYQVTIKILTRGGDIITLM
ncbi:MAG: class I SAM-dependent methyltransferase [Deltaproteobacteria bacterium]|nr:class I SAM-dependent methyltransferase [Candidatus Zymogenaceae bacterium]